MNIFPVGQIATVAGQVATKSAMNPILYMIALSSPVSVFCCLFAPPPLNYFLAGLGALAPLVGVYGFIYFMRKDPARLQSENHIQQMEILGRMGAGGQEIVLANAATINNPALTLGGPPALTLGGPDE